MLQPHLKLTREELYSMVWSKPMLQVAREFHISDRAMAKLCAKKQVPVPPRGYWAKKSANKSVIKPLLPVFVAKPPKPKLEEKTQQRPEPQRTATTKRDKVKNIFEERNQAIRKRLKEFRAAISDSIQYTVRIETWGCDYSFGLNYNYDPMRDGDRAAFLYEYPYDEYRDLVLKGVFQEPKQLKGHRFEAHFTRRPHLNKEAIQKNLHRYEDDPPKSVGGFLRQNEYVMGFLSMPEDAYAMLHQNAMAGKLNFMTLRAQKLKYGRGQIYRYSLREEPEE